MVADVVLELTGVVRLAKADFADGKPKMIADIRGRLCSRGRTGAHQDTHKLNRNRVKTEASGYIATGAVAYDSLGKHEPFIVHLDVHLHRDIYVPILNPKQHD